MDILAKVFYYFYQKNKTIDTFIFSPVTTKCDQIELLRSHYRENNGEKRTTFSS